MARAVKTKELVNSRLATNYGGWMYCTSCNKNIGYLCYVTYDEIKFEYECHCGSHGKIQIDFEDTKEGHPCDKELVPVKNRLCCATDESPLITILDKNLKTYSLSVTCKNCGTTYQKHE